jgi:hypothetical protein
LSRNDFAPVANWAIQIGAIRYRAALMRLYCRQ